MQISVNNFIFFGFHFCPILFLIECRGNEGRFFSNFVVKSVNLLLLT